MAAVRPRVALGLLAGCALAAAATGAVLFARYGARSAPDPRRVAVAPFDIFVPSLDGWRVALAEALSARLDSTPPFSAVPQAVVARRWRARATPVIAAVELARQTGAGLAVYGRVDAAGADSLLVRVAVLDAIAARPLFEIDLRQLPGSLEAVADSLARAVLRVLRQSTATRP